VSVLKEIREKVNSQNYLRESKSFLLAKLPWLAREGGGVHRPAFWQNEASTRLAR